MFAEGEFETAGAGAAEEECEGLCATADIAALEAERHAAHSTQKVQVRMFLSPRASDNTMQEALVCVQLCLFGLMLKKL